MQLRYIATTIDGSNLLFIYLFLTTVISWQIRRDNLLKLFFPQATITTMVK